MKPSLKYFTFDIDALCLSILQFFRICFTRICGERMNEFTKQRTNYSLYAFSPENR